MSAQLQEQVTALAAELRTLRDIEAVRQLIAQYHLACDGWDERGTHRDVEAIAALFTPDGVWDIPAQEEDGVFGGSSRILVTGHDEITAFARNLQAIHWIIHFVVNPIVTVDGDRATGQFKGFVRFKSEKGADPAWVCGIYRAEAVRMADGWRFSRLAWDHLDTL